MARHDAIAEVTGLVWKLLVAIGDEVAEGAEVAILESMKMEVPVYAPVAGRVVEIVAPESAPVEEGATVVVIEAPS
ncbi:MAG: acetyl-CoA carboxylase biotin carboxyl carrier protein subunit [Pseudomonadota bacterium]